MASLHQGPADGEISREALEQLKLKFDVLQGERRVSARALPLPLLLPHDPPSSRD
jgi:hypothetical protein